MKRILWGMLFLILVAAVAWAAFAVPIGGRTLVERLRGIPAPVPTPPSHTAKVDDAPAAPSKNPSVQPSQDSDKLTEQDRQNLDRLLEKRLQGSADTGKKDKP